MSRIEWSRDGWSAENGRVNGLNLFQLRYPSEWSPEFTLLSPLIPAAPYLIGVGMLTLPALPPETVHTGRPTRAEIRAAFDADQERFARVRASAKEVAEQLLVDFARSILGLDAPSKTG